MATVVTFFAVDAIFSALPFGREVLEAVVGLLAVAMLFYVSFWLIARLDQRRRMEFLQARVWKAASVGSATSLALVGLHRGLPRGLRDRALLPGALLVRSGPASSGSSSAWAPPPLVLGGVAWAVLKLGRKLPVKQFLTGALVDRDALLGRRARQRAAGPAGGGRPRPPRARRVAEPADLPRPGHRLLPDARRASSAQAALLVVYLVGGIVTYRLGAAPPGSWPRQSRRRAGRTTPTASVGS